MVLNLIFGGGCIDQATGGLGAVSRRPALADNHAKLDNLRAAAHKPENSPTRIDRYRSDVTEIVRHASN